MVWIIGAICMISRVRLFVREAKRKVRIFSVSCRSAMNSVRGSLFAVAMRNSGSVQRSAFCHDEFGGRDAGTNGSQAAQTNPKRGNDGKTLEQSLS